MYVHVYIITGLSHQGALQKPMDFVASLPDNEPIAFVLGGFAVGQIEAANHPYVRHHSLPIVCCLILCNLRMMFPVRCLYLQMQEFVSISEYPLSGVVAINRLLGAIENSWGVV